MVDATKPGTDWEDEELDLIVADYFEMLAADLSGQPYVKSQHNAALRERIGRSRGSVEFKHENISAVLERLGMPWIPGYKPRSNYQSAIFGALDRYLTKHPQVLQPVPALQSISPRPAEVFVAPPQLATTSEKMAADLQKLVQKFDRSSGTTAIVLSAEPVNNSFSHLSGGGLQKQPSRLGPERTLDCRRRRGVPGTTFSPSVPKAAPA